MINTIQSTLNGTIKKKKKRFNQTSRKCGKTDSMRQQQKFETICVAQIEEEKGDVHRKKRFTSFPSPARMSLTKLPLGRNISVMTSLFPPRESLVVSSRLETRTSRTFFYGVLTHPLTMIFSVEPCSKNAGKTSIVLQITARE